MNKADRDKRDEDRMLLVIYELTEGEPGRAVEESRIFSRCKDLDIFEMSDASFETYRASVLARFPGVVH